MGFTVKQREFLDNANHRWNIKQGATRSGKTYLDYFVIPLRIRRVRDKPGLYVMLGNTKGTLQRNIIEPLQDIYGKDLVTSINSNNISTLFGEKCYCLGADKANQVDRIRGSSIKYCYGDEVATWHEDVFTMLKSRLDKEYSKFDGTLNPESPQHWFKRFLESDADIYCQNYTIDDNPTLDPVFVQNLKREYAGTVYYNRYILGQWAAAEGACYPLFAAQPDEFILRLSPPVIYATIGVDFGGGKSGHAFSCTGYTYGMSQLVVLDEYYCKDALDPATLEQEFCDFVTKCKAKYTLADVWCDSAEQTLINGLRIAADRNRLGVNVGNAAKKHITDRIRAECRLMAAGRFKVMAHCTHTIDALRSAVYDKKHLTEDVRLDNGTSNIDSLDALEYSFERDINDLLEGR